MIRIVVICVYEMLMHVLGYGMHGSSPQCSRYHIILIPFWGIISFADLRGIRSFGKSLFPRNYGSWSFSRCYFLSDIVVHKEGASNPLGAFLWMFHFGGCKYYLYQRENQFYRPMTNNWSLLVLL